MPPVPSPDEPSAGLSVEVHVPVVRPFRALRYSPEAVADLASVVAPPYDVIGPDEHRRLLARDPRNVVRLDLPTAELGDADPDERYRRAARLLAAWRGDGTLRQDPRPAVYVVEDAYRLPGGEEERVRVGFLARVRLEPFGAGIRAHERTLTAPKEDRYRLLRATGVNTSPVVAMYEDPGGRAAAVLAEVTAMPPILDILDAHGVRHRLWPVVAGEGSPAEELCSLASASALTIADGHHRYETALRYRDERRAGSPGGADLDSDDVLMLLLEPVAGALDILATHRVVRGLDVGALAGLEDRLAELFEVEWGIRAERLATMFGAGPEHPEAGTFGLWTNSGGAILHARPAAFDRLLAGVRPALRRLDVTRLGAALEVFAGIDAAAIAAGERVVYTKDAAEAIAMVRGNIDCAVAAFLLTPTPARAIIAAADDGDVMPQKSTYIHPKALTGLVINPLEG